MNRRNSKDRPDHHPYFSGTKSPGFLDHVPGARSALTVGKLMFRHRLLLLCLWRLTGGKVHATDATNASRTAAVQHPQRAMTTIS